MTAKHEQTQVASDQSDGTVMVPTWSSSAAASEGPPRQRKVAILGSADSSIDEAPFDDDSWERWGLAWSHHHDKFRCTRYFDPHRLAWMKQRHENYEKHLRNLPAPVYVIEWEPGEYDHIENCIPMPIEEMVAQVGGYANLPRGSHMSSIAYELLMCLYEDVDQIGLWGIDLLTEGERVIERPNCEYLVGVFEGRKGKESVYVPPSSALLKGHRPYGSDLIVEHEPGINWQYLRERCLRYDREREGAQAEANKYEGARQAIVGLRKKLEEGEEITDEMLRENLDNVVREQRVAQARAQTFDGAYQEADALMTQAAHYENGGVVAASPARGLPAGYQGPAEAQAGR